MPVPIGTPPETERERLERELVEARSDELTAGYGGPWHMVLYSARALADHIIKETTR